MERVLFSSKSDNWSTPQDLYDQLDSEFHFTLDPCADDFNHKCEKYFTIYEDGLSQDWSGNVVFCNPPYGRNIINWVRKSYLESLKPNTKVVMLIPSRTDTNYFHDFILPYGKLRFIRGRLHFGNSSNSAPFPSLIVIFG